MHAYVYMGVHATDTWLDAWVHVHDRSQMYTCTHAHMHTCTDTHMHRFTDAQMHTTCTCAHLHTSQHAHMHTCTHAHMHIMYTCRCGMIPHRLVSGLTCGSTAWYDRACGAALVSSISSPAHGGGRCKAPNSPCSPIIIALITIALIIALIMALI